MFTSIMEEQGFVWTNDRWEHPKFPWVLASGTKPNGSISIRGFMNKPRVIREPLVLQEAIASYKSCNLLAHQYNFAVDTLSQICDELNSHYNNAEFSHHIGSNGVPVISVRFPKSDLSVIFASYTAFMTHTLKKRASDFSMTYVELAESYAQETKVTHDVVVKSTDTTLNVFVDIRGLRNSDLWLLHNVVEVNVHKIVAEFPTCPALLAPELADSLKHTYVEFVCKRKG